MNTILSTLLLYCAGVCYFTILPVKGVQNINGKELKSIVGKKGSILLMYSR